jgi:hypothetical protein
MLCALSVRHSSVYKLLAHDCVFEATVVIHLTDHLAASIPSSIHPISLLPPIKYEVSYFC